MKTHLVNHLRIPGDVPSSEGLTYLEQVEATVAPYAGKWLAQGSRDVLEGACLLKLPPPQLFFVPRPRRRVCALLSR